MTEQDRPPLPADLQKLLGGVEARPDPRTARMQARAAEKRTDRHDAVQTWAEKRALRRAHRKAARADRRERSAEQRADRAAQLARHRARATTSGRLILITFPILAPMVVAWTGQSEFAMRVLGWQFAASIVYAAAYELTTAFCAWMYHEARKDGDHGWEYRLATWIFAAGAAAQQWWHYSDHGHATPRSVTYSVMSGIGVVLWELYARLIHRRKLRAEGKLPPVRPRIGLARWLRYPARSWTTRSLIILRDYETLAQAWTAADETIRDRQESRDRSRRDRETRDRPTPAKTAKRRPGTRETAPETGRDRTAETETPAPGETETPQVTPETGARETTETTTVAMGDREAEIRALVSLMETRGDPMAVSLTDAIETTGCPKSTAAKRLAAARDRYRKTA